MSEGLEELEMEGLNGLLVSPSSSFKIRAGSKLVEAKWKHAAAGRPLHFDAGKWRQSGMNSFAAHDDTDSGYIAG